MTTRGGLARLTGRTFSLGLALALASLWCPPASAQVRPPPPPATGPHHYNPGSRTVHTTYTCMDGARSVTLHYGQVPKGQATSLSRNGLLMSPAAVEQLNRILAPFDSVFDIYPQCGTGTDLMYVTGVIGARRTRIEIHWSPRSVELVQDDVR